MIVNQTDLADVVGVSVPTLRQWRKSGMPVLDSGAKGREAKFDTAAVIAWLVAREGADPADARVAAQRERLLKVQADRAEIDLRQHCGELVRKVDVEKGAYQKARVLRDRILSIPDRLAPIVAAETDPRRTHELLRTEILSILRALATGNGHP